MHIEAKALCTKEGILTEQESALIQHNLPPMFYRSREDEKDRNFMLDITKGTTPIWLTFSNLKMRNGVQVEHTVKSIPKIVRL